MLTLFHAPKSRSTRMIWLLEELGAPYEIQVVDIARRDGVGAKDPANPHPHKQVPALLDDGVLISESVAIALYLTDKFPAAGIGPVVGDPLRGPYLTWLAYYAGVLEPVIGAHFEGRTATDPALKAQYEAMDARLKSALEPAPTCWASASAPPTSCSPACCSSPGRCFRATPCMMSGSGA